LAAFWDNLPMTPKRDASFEPTETTAMHDTMEDDGHSNEQTGAAPSLPKYPGIASTQIVLVQNSADAQHAYQALSGADMLGFDTESKPTFVKGQSSDGPHLIQLATDTQAFLFPMVHATGAAQTERIAVVKALLEANHIVKVGFGLGDDTRRLQQKFQIETNNVLDLSRVMRESKYREMGAKAAVAKYFGMTMQKSKKTSTSNWANEVLTQRQIQYAADDAQVALLVYRRWLSLR
jgi:ribonuclease D